MSIPAVALRSAPGPPNAPEKRVPLVFVGVSSNFDIQFLETKYEFPVFVGTDDIVRCLNIRYIFRYWHFANFSPSVSAVLRGRFARFTVNREKCRGIDWQRIRLQEDFSELATGTQRRMPRTVDCDLKRSLVGSCVPGDVVTLLWALNCYYFLFDVLFSAFQSVFERGLQKGL